MSVGDELLNKLISSGKSLDELFYSADAEECERDLYTYLQRAWPAFDPSVFKGNWHLEGICEHLEAVSYGEIRFLLINVPPRHSKTSAVALAWPTWTWAKKANKKFPLIGPHVRFLCTAYGTEKAQEDGVTARRLIGSNWYQDRWKKRFSISKDRDNQERYDNDKGGSRVSTGLGGAILGRGGDIKIIDDPIKTDDANSEVALNNVIRAYDEMFSTRANDPKVTAEVVIMQRLHENDLSGHILSRNNPEWVHLMVPAEYEWDRHCSTMIGWSDPRGSDEHGIKLPDNLRKERDGILLWPDRMGARELAPFKLQPYSFAGQFQQRPEPRGGGIVKPEWWREWPIGGEDFDVKGRPTKPLIYPAMDYIVAYLDTALTTKEENDPSAMTVWGTWRGADGQIVPVNPDGTRSDESVAMYGSAPRIMLMEAWDKHLAFNDLVQKVIETCRRRRVDRLIIEGKTIGLSVAQEISRLCRGEKFSVSIDKLSRVGDKDARLHSIVHLFSSGIVYAPVRNWSERVKLQCSAGSKGKHDDLADTVSGALRYLRTVGEAQTQREYESDVRSSYSYSESVTLYDDVV